VVLHEPLHTMQAAGLPRLAQVPEYPPSTINTITGRVRMSDEFQQPDIVLGSLGDQVLQSA